MTVYHIDHHIIRFLKKYNTVIGRVGLAVIFGWFGMLKIFDLSPATPLVLALFQKTMSGISFPQFMILFGGFEVLIGLLFLIQGAERLVLPLLVFHMIMTFLPLILLPDIAWTRPFVPTLEGQYIIKNLALIAVAVSVTAHLHELKK